MVPNHTNQSVNAKNQYKDLNTYKRKIKAEKTALDFNKTQFQKQKHNSKKKRKTIFFFQNDQ